VVKDKVAAILYCDSGRDSGRQTDYSAVEVLTRFTCLWLEHAALKKHMGPPQAEAASTSVPTSAPPPAPVPAPVASAAKTAPAPEQALDGLPADEQDLHKKAKRFAKLLVDEIKLYNQSKVAEGRQNHDLYKVLREDIEKSRATYEKRYGGTPVASAKYFDSEIVRILADNDRSLLGNDFPG
jgi:pyruvate/2-oxoglutarate dehydrogenase complex dihydrolipoamide acyltransferase (E2) component